jgi:hypothetical protein
MLTPNLKLKYELHYWDTDVTGSSCYVPISFRLTRLKYPIVHQDLIRNNPL